MLSDLLPEYLPPWLKSRLSSCRPARACFWTSEACSPNLLPESTPQQEPLWVCTLVFLGGRALVAGWAQLLQQLLRLALVP